LLRRSDVPIAAPSANLFGRLSPTTAAHVAEQLGDQVDLILDGGECRVGIESTGLQLNAGETPRLLRPRGIPVEDLERLIGKLDAVPPTDAPSSAGRAAPGMLPQHCAPRTPLQLSSGAAVVPMKGRVGLLAFRAVENPERFAAIEVLSPEGD